MSNTLNWLKQWQSSRQMADKPAGLQVPDRVWRRHSALLLSLHEQRQAKS